MAMSELSKGGIIGGVCVMMLGGMAALWNQGTSKAAIDPMIEKACFDEVARRATLGQRAITTFDYREESSNLGIVTGGVEAQYAPGRWTQALWTCRIDPTSRTVARVEFSPASGGNRLRAAASPF